MSCNKIYKFQILSYVYRILQMRSAAITHYYCYLSYSLPDIESFLIVSTRGASIDLVEGYGTKESLDAFRRFYSLHGHPSKVFTHHSTQLASANKELEMMTANWNNRKIEDFVLVETVLSYESTINLLTHTGKTRKVQLLSSL